MAYLLWTGGWDSTFRLLQLLLQQRRIVQPYYVISHYRGSVGAEIRAMLGIRAQLSSRYSIGGQLLPTRYVELSSITAEPSITAAFKALRGKKPLGRQYDWLARFCAANDLRNVELCLTQKDKARAAIAPFTVKEERQGEKIWQMDGRFAATPQYYLFRFFCFPLFELSKAEMWSITRKCGWDDLMRWTWFCHRPRRNRPCGACNPCLSAVNEEFGWRIPVVRRVKHWLQTALARS